MLFGLMADAIGWSEERIEKLETFWRLGFSASTIAANLGGVSRSAVVGKAKRLGLPRSSIEDRIVRLSRSISEGEEGSPIEGISQGYLYEASAQGSARFASARAGQSTFRAAVIARYANCAVTGCETPLALQAAHIVPYARSRSQDPERGILLRADIHSLFDAGLIAVAPITHMVLVATNLEDADYRALSGIRAHFSMHKPQDADLAWHVASVFQAS